jgi:hypothetical protein
MLYPQVGRRMKHPFYFPLLFLRPNLEGDLTIGQYAIAVRKWSTSTFDLATLATQHDLHIPYQVMDVMLSQCNIELAICDVTSHDQAIEHLDYFRVGAYLAGCSPFVVPFVTTKSVNEYSGINERDSALQLGETPKVPSDFSSTSGKLSAWPVELSFSLYYSYKRSTFHKGTFLNRSSNCKHMAVIVQENRGA